jgi:alkylation response protein AidB-like acyl-CoA dehydrogenase
MLNFTRVGHAALESGAGRSSHPAQGQGSRRSIELQPKTFAGAQLVASAESLAGRLSVTAAEHDTRGKYPLENVDSLKEVSYFTAPIPRQFGGLGVDSFHDILIASSRLARGDPSTTLGLNMHLLVVLSMVNRWRTACHRGQERRAEAFGRSLSRIVADKVVMAAAISEPTQNLTEPGARATRNDRGWLLNGRKIFCTMSPAATVLLVSATYEHASGDLLYGYVEVPTDTPGVTILDDWDALGMRASGSNSVSLRDVQLPDTALRGGFPVGDAIGYIQRNLGNGLFHAAASVGIAESAHSSAIERLNKNKHGPAQLRAPEYVLVADNAIDLSALRATFGRAAGLVEDFHLDHLAEDAPADDWGTIFAEVQAAKTFVNAAAARIVDRALTLSGGAGYMRSHTLSRAYRDVRAGAFMQPLGAVRAYDYLGQAALGLTPSLS